MPNKKTTLLILIIIAISLAIAIYLYPTMPDQIASHWNTEGEVDGYMSKFWGLFLMPIISVVIFLLFIFVPMIDPLKKNIEKFRQYYDGFMVLMVLFLFYIYFLSLLWNFDYRFNMIQAMSPAFAILFYYCGVLVQNAKRNWFIGIRTPWTLSSDKAWQKTHALGGKLYKACGLIALLGLVVPDYAIFVVIIPVVVVAVYLIIYSYFAYKK